MKNNKYVQCNCGNELLQISRHVLDLNRPTVPEELKDPNLRTYHYDFCMHEFGLNWDTSYSFKQRIKYMWHILRTGHPYSDQLTLSHEQFGEMLVQMTEMYCDSKE